jgi:general secretion pathway protein E
MADVVGRFRHFGLDMFGFMSSLNGVVVQRLVRQLCPACATHRRASDAERVWLSACGLPHLTEVPSPTGCTECHGSGYKGRFVVAEIHAVDDRLRDHVIGGAPLATLKAHAASSGVQPLAVQAAHHVAKGRTTPEEIKRVVGWL